MKQRLEALKDLGVGIIWFLPIFPTGGNPPDKPRSDSAYCVRDYYDVNPRHGTKEEFKHLVAAIHARGMYVIMDWVPNHTAWGNELIKSHPRVLQERQGRPHRSSRALERRGPTRLLEPRRLGVHVSGPQVLDHAVRRGRLPRGRGGGLPLEHWQWLRPKLEALKPVFMLAEADAPRLHPAFDMTYDWTARSIST